MAAPLSLRPPAEARGRVKVDVVDGKVSGQAAAEGARLPFNQRGNGQPDLQQDGKVRGRVYLGDARP